MVTTPLVQRVFPEHGWGGFTRIDGTVQFYQRVQALLPDTGTILDLGCGRGKRQDDPSPYRQQLQELRGPQRRVIGIYVDPAAQENPFIDEFHLIEQLDHWPIDDASMDFIVSDFVVEHVTDPDAFFSEVQRVLKPSGVICIRTPNAWSYVALAARLIPNRMHARVLRVAQSGRKEEDVFPTVYRCNTAGRLRRTLARHGLQGVVYAHEAEPGYLAFSSLLYRLAAGCQPLLPAWFRTTLLAFGRKT
ncbi:MAG TPA: class I SAM-dependent methyltransferase [Pirellulaceae bacterium]|nr:class I SAM-dependent methyltransferase [Pirellulaceae bacterium]